jgi:hypothetical protein
LVFQKILIFGKQGEKMTGIWKLLSKGGWNFGWVIFFLFAPGAVAQKPENSRFRVLALYENGGHHIEYSRRAVSWLDQLARDSNFEITYLQKTDSIDGSFLSRFQLFIQLDYPPYHWGPKAETAFQEYIQKGMGGWIGFHHASLLGEFDGYAIWPWFYGFMGSIRWKNYIPGFADAMVYVEDRAHPCLAGIPDSFLVKREEWYTYDRSPRQQVRVLARVEESSYRPDTQIKMGDHPVIWSNPRVKARNIYIFMGHSPDLFDNPNYVTLFRNAIFWAARH